MRIRWHSALILLDSDTITPWPNTAPLLEDIRGVSPDFVSSRVRRSNRERGPSPPASFSAFRVDRASITRRVRGNLNGPRCDVRHRNLYHASRCPGSL